MEVIEIDATPLHFLDITPAALADYIVSARYCFTAIIIDSNWHKISVYTPWRLAKIRDELRRIASLWFIEKEFYRELEKLEPRVKKLIKMKSKDHWQGLTVYLIEFYDP